MANGPLRDLLATHFDRMQLTAAQRETLLELFVAIGEQARAHREDPLSAEECELLAAYRAVRPAARLLARELLAEWRRAGDAKVN